jgi:sulfopyruvate decarboxylase subunit alpha
VSGTRAVGSSREHHMDSAPSAPDGVRVCLSGRRPVQDVNVETKLDGSAIISTLIKSSIEVVVAVPDITTSAGLLWPLSRRPEFKLVRVCKEDEGISICSALSYCNLRSVLLMQQTGLFDSLNAVRGIAVEYKQPVCMLVGMLGKEPGLPSHLSKKYSVRIVEPVLKAMEVDYIFIENDADIHLIGTAIDRAYEMSRPVVMLFGRRIAE